MKKLIKPASLLLYLLAVLVFFILVLTYGGLSGAGKGQGLAGGAIVFGYGLVAAFLALIVYFFVAFYASHIAVVKTNRILTAVLTVGILYTIYQSSFRQGEVQRSNPQPTIPVKPAVIEKIVSISDTNPSQNTDTPMGLGFFSPDYFDRGIMYFYGNPAFGKSAS
ncbi:hypothetical protein [Persicitalea sp.]|uniref:hypothetical protein n=1 Tax=Persicitalea sp. TaxID=3100273 RepID=UPI00359490D3